MQQRNLVIFFVLSATLIGLWYYFLAPPTTEKKEDPDKKQVAQNDKDKDAKDKDGKDKKPAQKIDAELKKDPEKEKKTPDKAKSDPEKDKKQPEKKEVPQEPVKVETIGGKGYHLSVDVTTRGAGVRKVVLDHFEAADWRGRPAGKEFELIQDDEFVPSFRMYHYPDPKDVTPVPVLGLGEKNWTLEGKKQSDDEAEVRFSTTVPDFEHIKIVKTYRLKPKDYHVTMVLEFHDTSKQAANKATPFRYQLTGARGLPIEGEWYTAVYRNSYIGLVDSRGSLRRKMEESIRISGRKGGDRYPEGSRADSRIQYAGVANQFFGVMIVVDNEQPAKDDGGVAPGDILAWARPTLETVERRGFIRKIDKNKDFIVFEETKGEVEKYLLLPRLRKHLEELDVSEGQEVSLSSYKTHDGKRVATWLRLGTTPRPQFDDITVRVNSEAFDIYPNSPVKHQYLLYHGPVKAALLGQFTGDKAVPEDLVERYTQTLHLRTLTDYPSDNWVSNNVFSPIGLTYVIIQFTRLMHWLLNLLQYVVGYGLGIVVLTVIVRGCMYPISRKQAIFSMKMQELAPELKKIQDRYPDDPQAKMQATQEFYRKHGINPLGSCWPVFLQMPIFLGLYFALQESIHFRLADFLWMKNLAAPDMLIWWTEQLPYISNPDNLGGLLYLGPFLNILPMVAVVLMMVQQMQTMPPPTDEQQAMQQKMLKYMTIFFGIMFYKVAAGLCIYFIASSLWGMAERKLLPKKKNPALAGATPGVAGPAPAPVPPAKGKSKWTKKEKEKDRDKDKAPVTTMEKLKALWQEILKQAEKK